MAYLQNAILKGLPGGIVLTRQRFIHQKNTVMKKILLPALLGFLFCHSYAQTDSLPAKSRKINFRATMLTMDKKIFRGSLSAVTDSLATMYTMTRPQGSKTLVATHEIVAVENIKSISFKRKNSGLKGALIGLGVGALTGVIIGFASGDDPLEPYPDPADDPFGINTIAISISNSFAMTAREKAVAGGIAMGTGGAIVGAIIGAIAHKKFTIGGKKEKFHDLQSDLMRRIVVK